MWTLKYKGKRKLPIRIGGKDPKKDVAWLTKEYVFNPTANVRDVDAKELLKANPRMFEVLSVDGKVEETPKVEVKIEPPKVLPPEDKLPPEASNTMVDELQKAFDKIDSGTRSDLMEYAKTVGVDVHDKWNNRTLKARIKEALQEAYDNDPASETGTST